MSTPAKRRPSPTARRSLALGLSALSVLHAGGAVAAPREIVVAHEVLLDAGGSLEANVETFVRRLEEVAGFPKNSFRGRAFVRPGDALAYIREKRVGFAILPAHQVAESQKSQKLLRPEILGRAVGIEGPILQFVTVTRRPRPFADVEVTPGLRVAASETYDPAWLAIVTEGDLDPRRRPLSMSQMPSSQSALDALLLKKADLAILHPMLWPAVKKRTEEGGDLEWVVSSPKLPPSAFVAFAKHASGPDRKRMASALDKICKAEGADACGRMGIMYIEAGRADSYNDVIAAYELRSN